MDIENNKHWLDQLEVTGPIKGIMDFVEELSRNYDRRLAAMHVEYEKDVEEILSCYKQEKQEFATQLAEQQQTISKLQEDLKSLQQTYKTMHVEYKLTQESLETTKAELIELSKILQKEEELVALTKERIQTANEQIRQELNIRGVQSAPEVTELEPVVRPKRSRMRKTREFFQQVVADRLTRPIILRPKKDPIVDTDLLDDQDAF